jgi:hypothetical protein
MSADWYQKLTRQVRESKREATEAVIAKRLADREKSHPA